MDDLYRTMRMDADGQPLAGRSARTLGVRIAGPHADVHPDEHLIVNPGSGGMSVTIDDPKHMPVSRRPAWLLGGASEDPLYVLKARVIVEPLRVVVEGGSHGLIEPTTQRRLSDFERDLVLTRPYWRRFPEHGGKGA